MPDAPARGRGHRGRLRPQPGAVRPLARHRAGRDGDADGPQRHGQDHHRARHHGADAGLCRIDPVRRGADPRQPLLPHLPARRRPGAGGAAGVPQPDRAREPDRHRRQPARDRRSLDARQGLRAVPAAGGADRQHGQPALRRRAADAGGRPRAHDQSRACSSSTRRPRVSRRSSAPRSGAASAVSRPRASRSSSSTRTSRRSPASPTATT